MQWGYAYTPYIWPMLAAAALTALVSLFSWHRRATPGALPLAVLALVQSLWALGAAMEMAGADHATKIIWAKLQSGSGLVSATVGLWFALDYANLHHWLTRRVVVLLAAPVVLFLALIPVDDTLHWVWTGFSGEGYALPQRALGGSVILAYGFLLSLSVPLIFVWLFVRSPHQRLPISLMLSSIALTRVAFVLDTIDQNPFAPMSVMILASAVASCLYTLALFRFHMFDPTPIAQKAVVQQMPEGMLVLNTAQQIVGVNPAAESILGIFAERARHMRVQDALSVHPNLCALIDGQRSDCEVTLEVGGRARCFLLQQSHLKDPRGMPLGQLILLHEVTEYRRAQEQLVQQQRVVATLEERERLARELHDGLGQMLTAAHLYASSAKRLLAQGALAEARECLDFLSQVTLEAEEDVREHLLGARVACSADRTFFVALREYLAMFGRRYALHVELAVPQALEEEGLGSAVEVQVMRIIQEALSNIRKHAHAHFASITFEGMESQARIIIADDGIGFDPTAVASQGASFGLQSMRGRAESSGGSLSVSSTPGKGTRVEMSVPLTTAGITSSRAEPRDVPRPRGESLPLT